MKVTGESFDQMFQLLFQGMMQTFLVRRHIIQTVKKGQTPSVCVITLEKAGPVVNFSSAPKDEPDAVFFEQVEDDEITFVELWIGLLHFAGVKVGRSVPLDFFADFGVGFENDFPQRNDDVFEGMLEALDVGVDFVRF